MIEMVGDRGKFLQTLHAPEAKHRSLSPSERLMGILGAIVRPPACLQPIVDVPLVQQVLDIAE